MGIPMTGTDRGLPSHVLLEPPLGGLTKPSYAMCDQLRTVAHERLASRLGTVDQQTLDTIEKVVCRLLGFRR
jgi:mRNA interferase MazF